MTRWQYFEDAELLSNFLCEELISLVNRNPDRPFRLVLAGGGTPKRLYQCLAESKANLSHVHLYYGDERCLAADDEERNSQMVASTRLIERCAAHYPIPAELGPIAGAKAYAETLKDIESFDLVLLGMGEDGHTASLFPGQEKLWQDQAVLPVFDSPKPPSERVSLSPSRLQKSTALWVLVTGKSKSDALKRWKRGEPLPVARVSQVDQARVFCERAAAN